MTGSESQSQLAAALFCLRLPVSHAMHIPAEGEERNAGSDRASVLQTNERTNEQAGRGRAENTEKKNNQCDIEHNSLTRKLASLGCKYVT